MTKIDDYLREQLKDPEFAKAYQEANEQLESDIADKELTQFKTYLIAGVIKLMSFDYYWSFDEAVERFKQSKTYKLLDTIDEDTFHHDSPELYYDYWQNEQELGYPIDSASRHFAKEKKSKQREALTTVYHNRLNDAFREARISESIKCIERAIDSLVSHGFNYNDIYSIATGANSDGYLTNQQIKNYIKERMGTHNEQN